jgi:hypothetical protein
VSSAGPSAIPSVAFRTYVVPSATVRLRKSQVRRLFLPLLGPLTARPQHLLQATGLRRVHWR